MSRLCVLVVLCALGAAEVSRFAYLPPAGRDPEDVAIRFVEDDAAATPWERHVDRIISGGVARLALQLERVGAATGNSLFSPLSVASALALVLLGAGGETFLEVAGAMGLATGVELADKGGLVHEQFGRLLNALAARPGVATPTEAVSASAMFVQDQFPVLERFLRTSKSAYDSEVLSLDFSGHGGESRDAINSWIENRTHGRIRDFLGEPPAPATRLIIASALYFNGEWEYPFPKEITSKRPFYVSDSEVLEVAMMTNSAELPYHASPTLGCRVLGLPYKSGEVVMYLVLPDEPSHAVLQELQAKLTVQALEELVDSVQEEPVIVMLPRMKLEASLSLKGSLRQLGVSSLFDPARANLSLISPAAEGLYADDVLHKVEVEVTETGTVATSVTLVSVTRDGSRRNFRVDRPFLFFIRHRSTGLVLFWGSVVRPTPSVRRSAVKTGRKTSKT